MKSVHNQIKQHQVVAKVWGQVEAQVWYEVEDQVWLEVEDQVGTKRNQVWDHIYNKVKHEISS